MVNSLTYIGGTRPQWVDTISSPAHMELVFLIRCIASFFFFFFGGGGWVVGGRRHQMATFPCYWPSCGILIEFSHKGQWRGALVFSLICAWTSGWWNSREAGDLRRHRAHYDCNGLLTSVSRCHKIAFTLIFSSHRGKSRYMYPFNIQIQHFISQTSIFFYKLGFLLGNQSYPLWCNFNIVDTIFHMETDPSFILSLYYDWCNSK